MLTICLPEVSYGSATEKESGSSLIGLTATWIGSTDTLERPQAKSRGKQLNRKAWIWQASIELVLWLLQYFQHGKHSHSIPFYFYRLPSSNKTFQEAPRNYCGTWNYDVLHVFFAVVKNRNVASHQHLQDPCRCIGAG